MKKNLLSLLIALFCAQFAYGQWTALPSGSTSDLFAVDFYDAQNGVAAGANSTILITTNGGNSWTPANTGELRGDFRSVLMLHPDTIFAAAGDIFDSQLYRSTDGGQSWNALVDIAEIADSELGLVGMNYESVYYSGNKGDSWDSTELDLGSTVLMEQLNFADSLTGYLTGNVSGISSYSAFGFRTEDGGLNWGALFVFDFPNGNARTHFTAPHPDTAYIFTNLQVNFMPGPENQLVRMTDFYYDSAPQFDAWRFKAEQVNTSMPGLMISSYFVNGTAGFAGSAAGDIYRTENGGVDWTLSYDGDTSINFITAADTDFLYAVGGNGLILRYALSSGIFDRPDVVGLRLYPNPVRESIYLKDLPLTDAQGVLRSLNGQLIRSFTWNHGDEIPVSDLTSGLYLLELRSADILYRSKFQKQ